MSEYYHYPMEHIQQLRAVVELRNMSKPEGFDEATLEELRACYNGIGPDRWSNKFRGTVTQLLNVLEAPALIHDWEYSQLDKSYWKFTKANLRLCWNSCKDKRFKVGLAAGVLCQLFGYSGFAWNRNEKKETVDMKHKMMVFASAVLVTIAASGCNSEKMAVAESASAKNLNMDGYVMLGEVQSMNSETASPQGKMIIGRLTYKSRKVGIPADQKVPASGYYKSTKTKSLFGTEEEIVEYDFTAGSDSEISGIMEGLKNMH